MVTKQEAAYLESFRGELEAAAEELRTKKLPELREEDFLLFQRTGNRLVYENAYFGRRKYLTVFGILAEFGKRREDVEMLSSVIDAVCEEKYWALPAHVNAAEPDVNTVDLFAAETAQTLAEMVYLFGDLLPARTAERAREEIRNRVLGPFCSRTYGWETNKSNWSAVCAGSVGMAAIYMNRMGSFPKAMEEQCIRRVCDALKYYLDGMEEDGACTEGLGYFSYGMSYYAAFAELFCEESGGKVNLMTQPKCDKIAMFQQKCFFGNGLSLSFSDGSRNEKFLPGLTAFLAHQFPQVKTPDYRVARGLEDDACYRWLTNERNIRWLLRYGGHEEDGRDLSACDLLPKAQWMICRDACGNGFAAKGGHNDENHNHNDVGSFLCVCNGEMLLADLGAGEYTKDYFGDGRYEILCNRSLGHSVPLINGREQCQGRNYAADSFSWNEEEKMLRISFAGAYPAGLVKELVRSISFSGGRTENVPVKLTVTDRFVPCARTEKITENLITAYLPKTEDMGENHGTAIVIEGEKSLCKIKVSQTADVRIIPKEHHEHDGSLVTVYLIQWDVPFCEDGATVEMEITMMSKLP